MSPFFLLPPLPPQVLLERFLLAQKNHELMAKWMAKFFMFLDRYLVKDRNLPKLRVVADKVRRINRLFKGVVGGHSGM